MGRVRKAPCVQGVAAEQHAAVAGENQPVVSHHELTLHPEIQEVQDAPILHRHHLHQHRVRRPAAEAADLLRGQAVVGLEVDEVGDGRYVGSITKE